ncbi:hypothetical protein [Thalassospira sp.]|uniref:hypothetical protein n=1 Tax=Thalassospira sp. TaxID=1912094 RepID=UPI002733C015|nr:hypothetical protein [Thalassospira sp.]MDP2698748.1 hypothetical protein [Thalassospira sp.]
MTSISGLFANTFSYASTNAGQKQTAASKPESVSASLEKTTPETAKAAPGSLASAAATAREKIDAGYAKLGTTGTTRTTANEWDAIGFPDFDRQMLYAVISNEGGMFTDVEVNAAKNEIANRISDIINSNDPLADNGTKAFRAILDFYDAASDEEKSSFEWAIARASAQKSYMLSGGTENVGTGNRVVDKLMQAWDQVVARGGNSNDFANMPAYREALTWWSQSNGGAHHVNLNV